MLNRTVKDLIQSGPLGQSRIENLFYFNSMNGPFEGFGYIISLILQSLRLKL